MAAFGAEDGEGMGNSFISRLISILADGSAEAESRSVASVLVAHRVRTEANHLRKPALPMSVHTGAHGVLIERCRLDVGPAGGELTAAHMPAPGVPESS